MKLVENHIMEESEEKRYHMCDAIVQDIEETIFDPESSTFIGDIFRFCQKEFGRCVSKVYIGDGEQIGWVFQKRERYQDSKETFIHETWVSLYDKWQPTIVKEPHVIK